MNDDWLDQRRALRHRYMRKARDWRRVNNALAMEQAIEFARSAHRIVMMFAHPHSLSQWIAYRKTLEDWYYLASEADAIIDQLQADRDDWLADCDLQDARDERMNQTPD